MMLCMKRLGVERYMRQKMGRYVMEVELEDDEEGYEVREMLEREQWWRVKPLKKLCKVPLILGAICGMRREDRKSASNLLRTVVEMILKKSYLKYKFITDLRAEIAKVAYHCFLNEILIVEDLLLTGICDDDWKMTEMIKGSGLFSNRSFIDQSIVAYLAAEHVCYGMEAGIANKMVSVWSKKRKLEHDLFIRCCIGIGGNVMNCLDDWIKELWAGECYLGPFGWINEDKTGKLRSYLKKNWKHWKSNVDDYLGSEGLLVSASQGLVESAAFFLKMGLDVNIGPFNDITALMDACESGTFEMVKYLVERGADIDAVDDDELGMNALMIACRDGSFKMVKYLVDNGADIEILNNEGWNAVMFACEKGNFEMVKYLLEKGADIHTVNVKEENALMYACKYGTFKIAKYLVEKGADIHAVNVNQENALMYACQNGTTEIVRYR